MEYNAVDGINAHEYRLRKINDIQKEIESERQKRIALLEKYKQAVKAVDVTNSALALLSVGLAAVGIGILSTVVAAPVAIVLQSAGALAGLFLVASRPVGKKLALKVEKHEKIKALADAKLYSISHHISKAIEDDYISDEEYSHVLSELEKFNQTKEEIRSKITTEGGQDRTVDAIGEDIVTSLQNSRNTFDKNKDTKTTT